MTAVALDIAFVRVLGPVQAVTTSEVWSSADRAEYVEMQVDALVPQLAGS